MRAASQRGFTLIEVLAAIVLLALAFAALLGTLGRASRLAANADAHTRAALCAQSALDGAFALSPVKPGITAGRCDTRYRWQLQATPWQVPERGPNPPPMKMYRLDLTVYWGQPGRRHKATFSTLRGQMSNPGSQAGIP